MKIFPEPREFQKVAHKKLQDSAHMHRRQLIMAPTGAGKTFLALRIINEALKKNKRALFVCDRITLIDQTSQVAYNYGMQEHGIIQGNHWMTNPDLPFQIASAQTLASRGWRDDYDVIVIDEAHTMHKTWVDYVKTCDAFVIALSATPFSKGLGNIFTNLVNAATMHELVESKILVPMRVFSCTKIDMSGIKTNGDWTDLQAEQRGMEIIGNVVLDWKKFGNDKKTIVFGATINHCQEMANQFNNSGVNAAIFCSDTKDDERKALLKEYRKPDSKIKVLISVEALSKGFDVPDVGCVCDVRPLRKSLSTAMQMWGRGMRSSDGKTELRLLDFSGNIIRFQEDFTDIYFNGLDALDVGEKLDKKVRKDTEEKSQSQCPKCGNSPFYKRCMSCGYEHKQTCTIESIPGVMNEIELCKKYNSGDLRNLWNQIATSVKKGTTNELKKKEYAKNLFKSITGAKECPYNYDIAPIVPVSRKVSGKIKALKVAYWQGRGK
ncbi:MAG: DEAD/DEAH box helicase [Candidatus Rickettsiella isopodorum]|nr:DEAD/DEAH box helicase [Candidatus Rickettsiella isopodorum]